MVLEYGIMVLEYWNTGTGVLEYWYCSIGILVLEYWNNGTGVLEYWYWSIGIMVLEYWNTGTGVLEYWYWSIGILHYLAMELRVDRSWNNVHFYSSLNSASMMNHFILEYLV